MPVRRWGAYAAALCLGAGFLGSLGLMSAGCPGGSAGGQSADGEPTAPATPGEPQGGGNEPPATAPSTTPASRPTRKAAIEINGVYVLGLEGRSAAFLRPLLDSGVIDGFSLRAGWSEVEPREGTYDWSRFDPVIALAAERGKKIMLRVLPGVRSPEWVYAAGAARFEFEDISPYHATAGEILSMPVPWDPVYLKKWLEFVAAFGAKYADHPAVTIVAVTGPATGGEMHLADKQGADAWLAAGYSDAVLVETWKKVIDGFSAAFPRQRLTVAIAHPTAFGNPQRVVDQVVQYCAETGCGIQGNWLAAKTQPQNPLYRRVAAHAAVAPVGFQMLSAAGQARFGGELRTAIDLALKANASYLEIYLADVSAYPDDVAYAHEQLVGLRK